MSFVHLHVHSCYSLLDGAIRIGDLVNTAKEMGMPAVALTDHGQMFGLWSFYLAAVEAGIKPILGVETYVSSLGRRSRDKAESRFHLTLLAQNLEGYHNLCRMISLANIEGFYYKPRVDHELLARHSGGIIALSGCLQGEVPKALVVGDQAAGRAAAERLSGIFPGRFYLELQENGIPNQAIANKALAELAGAMGLPLVATNDCHYLKKEHHEAHDVLLCIQTGKKLDEPARMRMDNNEYYFKSPEEMARDFAWCPEALANTLAIADRCSVEFSNADPKRRVYYFPRLPDLPEGGSPDAIMAGKAQAGLDSRLRQMEAAGRALPGDERNRYLERLSEEIGVINRMNFPGYFLIVADFINWAKDRGIPVGPGRGSAAGSLVAFSLGITDVDPLRFDLLFERFLNPERKSMPDIDVDFCAECREEVIRYVTETYGGGEYVAQILTLGQMKARAVIRDVGRVLGMSFAEVSAIAKIVPEKPGVALADVASLPEIKAAMEADDQVRKLISMALLLENLPHHSSTHASGVVIGDRPLMEHMPVFCDPKSPEAEGRRTQVITQYNFECVEQNGLVKFDLLGLKTLTLIKHCLALLREKGTELDLAGIDYADQKTFALLCSGDVSGLFQIENQGIRDVLVRLKPNRLEDIVALVALYRPGPLKSGMVDTYIRVKNGQAEAKYDLDVLRPILEETFGVIVYQEQVMRIAQVLAGYTLGKADELRKAMGKKRPEEMARHRAIFMEGTAANGIPEHKASQIFDLMEKFAEYGFNKSHSVAYAYITFQTAFLKAYHPVEFMASLISSEADNQEKISRLISECRQAGIEVRPPDVGTSHFRTSVEDGAIVFGLGAVKGLGQGAIEAIIEARAEGPFKDLFDFCARINGKKVTRRVVEALIKCGAFDKCGGAPREVLLTALPEAMDVTKSRQRRGPAGGATLFASLAPPPEKKRVWPKAPPMSENERLEQEKELLGFYVSGHPLARFLPAIEAIRTDSIPGAKTSRDRGKVRLCGQLSGFALKISKKGNSYASPLLSDHEDSIEVMVFDKLIKRRKDILADGRLVIVTGKIEGTGPEDSGRPKIMADDIADLEESLARMFPSLIVHTSVNDLEPVVSFLGGKTRPPVPKGGPATSVFLSIRDAQGRAIYRLDRKLDISVDFFAEASRSLGRYNTLACSELATPFSQYDDA